MATNHHPPGALSACRRLLDTVAGAVQNRVELFAVEFQQERANALDLFIRVCTVLFLGMMAALVLTGAIIFLFSEAWRVYVAGGLGVLYLAGALWALASLRARLRRQGHPFAETVREFKKDKEWLQTDQTPAWRSASEY